MGKRTLIIQYEMTTKTRYGHQYGPTEMCGQFDSIEHFQAFVRREEYNQRFVRNAKILEDRNENSPNS